MCAHCCGIAHQLCPPMLANLLACYRRKGSKGGTKSGVKDGAMLTPYELEQLPLMLRELERANRHFWQMVCWRMEQHRVAKEEQQQGGGKKQRKEENGNGENVKLIQKKGIDDSYADGCALRELVRSLAKTLCQNGTISDDDDCHRALADFRARLLGEQWPQPPQQQLMVKGTPPPNFGGKGAERRRQFAARGRAISFNTGLGNAANQPAGGKTSSSTASSGCSSSTTSSSGYSSEETNNARTRATSWLRQRAHSVRSRSTRGTGSRRCCTVCHAQQRIALLGELLCAEFHSTVFAHPELFDVHERELKVLVWRRFTLLLVGLLNEKRANSGGSEERRATGANKR